MGETLDLFESALATRARARTGDRITSRMAAEAATRWALSRTKASVLMLLKERPMCDVELVRLGDARGVMASPQSIRSRRAELVRSGHIEDSGVVIAIAGRGHTVWQLSPRGEELAAQQDGELA